MSVAPDDRLDSWKEIAGYLGRSVRTVRRWEAEGLPVHRHMHQALGSVYAYKSEVDAWRRSPARSRPGGSVSIVVLPFTNVSPDAENEYFADGLTDEVIADLSKAGAIRVISRTSSMALKGSGKDIRTIGRELGVDYVLEGTLRRAGSRLRVSARLIDARRDEPLWADKYDGVAEDVFDMQERLARAIVDALQVRLTADERRRLSERPIPNLHAYECYLQARYEALRWRRDAIDHAIQLLQNGLAEIGENVQLEAALGRAWLQYREAGIDFSDRPLAQAEASARAVTALDPGAAPGLQLQGWLHYSQGRIQEAVRALNAARAIEPNDADTLALVSNCYLISGRVAAARPLIAQLLALDPLTPLTRCMPGYASLLEGRLDEALEPYRQMFEMDPGNPMARLFYVWVLALNNRHREMQDVVGTMPASVAETVAARVARFLAGAAAGDPDAAAALSPGVDAAARATELFPRFLAHGYAMAGDADRAVDWLATAADRGFINYPFLAEHDPLLRPLRGSAKFDGLLDQIRRRWQAFEV
ncbi:MAG TPA: tetratricopeptide repeat protein [Vicinamibacterales bacterium]